MHRKAFDEGLRLLADRSSTRAKMVGERHDRIRDAMFADHLPLMARTATVMHSSAAFRVLRFPLICREVTDWPAT